MSDIRNLEIDLDIKQKLLVTVNCKQLDNLSLKFNIWDNGLSADLSNYKCRLKALKSGQIPLIQNTDIDVSGNEVTVEADEQLTTTSGIVKTELQFIDKITGKKKTSFDLNIKVISSTLESDRTISKATITLLEKLDNKLDQIEDIGNILDEAKTIKTGLETDITTANTSKNSLNTTITNADNKEKELETTIINAESKKEEVETSIGNANASKNNLNITITNADNKKTELETTITNAEDKKQEVILECKVADSKIKAMQEFGDVTEVAKDINKLKLDVGDTTELPTIDKSNVVNSIKEVNTKLKDFANNNLLINGHFKVWQRGTNFDSLTGYTADRWYLTSWKVNKYNVKKIDDGIQITITKLGDDPNDIGLVQTLEELDVIPLRGKKVTFSVALKLNSDVTSGNLRLSLYTGTKPNEISSTTGRVALHKDILFTELSVSEFRTFSITSDIIGSDVNSLSVIVRTGIDGGFINEGGSFIVKQAKLELGSKPTQFIPRLCGEELALCKRFFKRVLGSGYGYVGIVIMTSPTLGYALIPSSNTRINPTLSYSGSFRLFKGVSSASEPYSVTALKLNQWSSEYYIVEINLVDNTFFKQGDVCALIVRDGAYIDLDSEIY